MIFQLKTFQGVRYSLFHYNDRGAPGGCADFDRFTVAEPHPRGLMQPIPLGRTVSLQGFGGGPACSPSGGETRFSVWIGARAAWRCVRGRGIRVRLVVRRDGDGGSTARRARRRRDLPVDGERLWRADAAVARHPPLSAVEPASGSVSPTIRARSRTARMARASPCAHVRPRARWVLRERGTQADVPGLIALGRAFGAVFSMGSDRGPAPAVSGEELACT